ncbi:MAG: protein FxsA [Alphaproteobacteria bacterium]|nr:protein FxsA [Alphaproteobacteria bacterium]
MSLLKWTFLGVLLLPVAELVAFLLVAMVLGWWQASALMLATSVLGLWLLRNTGRANLARFAGSLQRQGWRAIHLESPGVAAVAGGILLAMPGFITDLLGVLLLFAPLRRWAGVRIALAFRQSRRRADPSLIELKPEEWHQVSTTGIEDAQHPECRRRVAPKTKRAERQ